FAALLGSCYKDLGNYSYREKTVITITNIPGLIEVLGDVDKITINPVITSSEEGEINADNPNFEYNYMLEYAGGGRINSGTENSGSWLRLNPRGNRDLDTIARLIPKSYVLWFSVKDKRTGIETITTTNLKVTSTTFEGWFVLCEEGAGRRVRMDFISKLGENNYVPTYDILATRNLPTISNAYGVVFHPSMYANPGDRILVMTGAGTFIPDPETFVFNTDISISDIKYSQFLTGKYPDENPVYFYSTVAFGGGDDLFVSDKGNAFCLDGGSAGAIYQDPINTTVRSGPPQYGLAPFIGINEYRTGTAKKVYSAIFYDKDNKRFVGWSAQSANSAQITTPLQDPPSSQKIFSYNTGMDLIYMESTRFSGGVTFAVMQDNSGNRHIYGLNYPSQYTIGQHSLVNNIPAPEFNQATTFAFSSQYAYTYYGAGNKVYSYDRGTNTTNVVLTLPAGEVVTKLKFVLIQNDLAYTPSFTEDFIAAQYNLVIGSYNSSLGNSGGSVRIMRPSSSANSLTEVNKWSGFGKIVDFAYRERR
ncbi:MAG: PKD-like family lipoprotein, partial [Bacteroidales bacterium]|nr:PKD-like family lipoprotein [Bacteroidales bacterium]